MKNLITYLKALWGAWGNLQSSDVRHDCRLTVGSPSGLDAKWKQNPFMRFAVVLTLIFTIGSGNVWGTDLTFNSFSRLGSSSYPSGSTTSTPITLASTGWYGASATELRIKSGATVTISCTSSYKITKIVFTATGASRANLNDPVSWSGTTGTYTNASGTTSVTFSNSAQCRFSRIVVTYESAGKTDPTASFSNGTYTIGGDALNLSSLWTSNSDGAVTYTVTSAGGTGASISTASFTATTAGSCTVKASQAATASYNAIEKSATITVQNPTCATPTFSPVAGAYLGTQSVTISCATGGSSIYYTTNGSTPTTSSTPYSGAISVSSTTTIKAIATKAGYDNSTVASATYTITPAYTVTWKNQGSTVTTTNVASGSKPVFPDMSLQSGCGKYTYFYGWAEDVWSGEVSSPGTSSTIKVYKVASEMPNVSGDVTYHAVWSDTQGGYALVESNLGTSWAGDYLIAYSSTVFADGRVGGTGTGGIGKQYVKANPGDNLSGKVVNATWGDTYHVTLEEILDNNDDPTNTYLLKTQDGQYNYQTSNANGLTSTSTRATAANYPITVTFTSSSDVKLGLGGSAAGAVFRYNTSEFFRYYKDGGQNAVYLYKKGASGGKCVTNCCNELGTINGGLTLTQGGNSVTISGWSDVSNVGTYTVKMYKKNGGGTWDLVSGTATGGSAGTAGTRTGITSGSKSVTYTGLEVESEYKFSVQAIAGSSSYCNGDETDVTSINSTDVSSTPFKFRYSIYIDNGSGSGWAHHYIEPTGNTDEGSVSITLGAHVDYYQFKIAGGFSGWWGQSGSSKIPANTQWTLNSDQNVRLETGAGGSYTFTVDYSGTTNPKVTVTFPSADQGSGYKIYFDKSVIADWGSALKYRIGNGSHNQSQDFTLVPGTDNFYVTTTPSYGSMDAWHIANNSGQTGSTSIYYTKGTGAITNSIAFQQSVVTENITIIPTTTHSTGGDDQNNNCQFYTINTPTSGMLTHNVAVGTAAHGTLVATYTNTSGTSGQTVTEGNDADLAHRCIITITATPDDGYTCTSLTVNSSDFTSGNTHILIADIDVEATFTAKTYNISLDREGATTGSENVTMTYNSADHTAITAPTKSGYDFGGWYTEDNGTGTQVMNASGVLQANVTGYTGAGGIWTKDATCTLYAKWTPTNYTLSYTLDGGNVASPNPTSYTIESAAITLNNPTKAGYDFAGWTGTDLAEATTTVIIAAGSTGNRSYTATWTAKNDTYKTALHTSAAGWTTYASGVTKSGAGYTIPAPSSVAKGATSSCEDTHYHFAGWVADEYKGSPSGHIIAASGTTDATGTTYWAVWEKEGAGGASLTKLTSSYEPQEGDNLVIVAKGTSYALYQETTNTSYVNKWSFENSAATVGSDDKNYITLESDGEGDWYLGDETNGYIYTSGSNNLEVNKSGSKTAFTFGTEVVDAVTYFTFTSGRWLSYRSDVGTPNYRLGGTNAKASGASGNALFDLYKYVGVSFEDPKAVCEACVATPSISGVSLMGTAFTTTSVPVQATGASAGENCSLAEYGFYWGTSADPSTNNTSSNNLSTGTFSATLTGPFVIGTTYHYRAYGTNEADNTGYSSDATFTLHNVTFNMHDHGDAKAAQVVPEGGKVTNPGNPSATGYTFDGWWANSTFSGSAWDFSTNTVGSGDVVLHAKWTEKPKYTITLNAGNGTVSADGWTAGVSPTWSKTQTNGDEEITFPAANPGCAGWVFKGWKQGSAADDQGSFTPDKTTGATLTPTSNVTYYAVYRQSTPSGTTYSKITSVGDLATTDYAIIAAFSESGNYYAMKNAKNGTYMQETSFTHADSWTNSDADYIWKVLVFGDKVAFYNADEEKFLTIVNGAWELATDGQFFTYSFNSTTKAWTFSSPSGKQLTYSTQFYVGDSQNKAIYLYKRGEAESGNYFTNPSCSDIAVNGVANPAAGGTVQLTATAAKSGDKVWACYTADEDYNFTNWSISGTGASLSSTSAQFTEITVGSADVTATANFTAKVWRTVTWKANGVTLTGGDLGSASVKVEDGHNITTLPPTPTSCESGVGASDQFVGWVVNSENWGNKINDVSAKHIYKRASQFPTVTGDVTYHAVWAASDNTQNHWEKVTDIADVEAGFKYAVISFDDAYYVKNTDQSTDKPLVYAVTKTAGDINYTSDMEFTASDGPSGGFIFTSVAVSGVKIWGSSTNDGVIVSTTSAKANASDEWFPELNATYGVIMTTSNSKYLCTYGTNDWRNYSSGFNASNRAANLYKYAYGHKNYMTLCCDKAITIASPTKTGSGTVTFTEDSPVPTCLGATTDIHVKITPSNGHKCTALTFTREDGEDIVIDVDPAAVIPFTAATDFVITVEQNANTTLNTSVTFTALHDYYIDNMHYNSTIDKSGGYGTAPTLSDESKGEQCTGLHYKFVGWIPETDMNMTTGVPTTTANMVAGGATGKYATGTNYYAIWAEEVTP